MSDTIERVLLNPHNGRMAVGIRLRFADKYPEEPLDKLEGYSIRFEPSECDAWAIDNEDGVWIVVVNELLGDIEDLGPL